MQNGAAPPSSFGLRLESLQKIQFTQRRAPAACAEALTSRSAAHSAADLAADRVFLLIERAMLGRGEMAMV
jgi:hypothetical protein